MFIIKFSLLVAFVMQPFEMHLEDLWEDDSEGFLPRNVKEYLQEAAQKGEKIRVAFYPQGSGFDLLVEDASYFIEMEEFFKFSKELGYKITYCMPQRYIAKFEDTDQLKEFIEERFQTKLIREDTPLKIPSKIIFVELVPVSSPHFLIKPLE